jgi:hypothetical protein
VAASGNTVVVGAPLESSNATGVNGDSSDNSAWHSGAAYVFARSGTNWNQQAYLKASNTGAGDGFGSSVAVSGDTVVVGASAEASNATGMNGDQSDNSAWYSGAAYVFVRSGVTWSQQAYLKASNTGQSDYFGASVALSGDLVVVGANAEASNTSGVNGNQCDDSAPSAGAAYVFDLNAVIPIGTPEIAVEQPSGNDLSDGLATVDFGTRLVGGSSQQRTFTIRNTGNAELTGVCTTITGAHANDFTVTAHPTTLVSGPGGTTTLTVTFYPGDAGARTAVLHIVSNDTDESPFDITLTGTGVTVQQIAQQAYLKASNTGAGDRFGHSLAVSGDTVVVGAPSEASWATGVNGDQSDDSAPDSGAAYVFVRSGMNWTQQAYLKASNTDAGDAFGISVAVSGDTVVVGAVGENSNAIGVNGDQSDNSAPGSGAAYVFVRSGTTWTQQAYLKPSNTGQSDYFGASVALRGDTVVVGAWGESSNATGVNGDQTDNNAADSGAAYVFVRCGTSWTQQAYLKASNTGANDMFGSSVALWGDIVVVGAYGHNGYRGAAYVFARSGTNWTQQAWFRDPNAMEFDLFGVSVAVWGDTAVIGDLLQSRRGAAYVFVRSGTNWSQQAYLTGAGEYFGDSVVVWGDTIMVGAVGPRSTSESPYFGVAYVFGRSGTNWSQQAACLKAADRWENRGPVPVSLAVAMFGDTVVAGAPYENDNSAVNAGAAYIFTFFSRVAIVPDGGGGYFLGFGGISGRSYRLERAPSVTGPWNTLTTLTAPASGLLEYHEMNPPSGQAFFRTVSP